MEDKINKITLRKEGILSSEVPVNLYTTRLHHISAESFVISHRIVSQRSHIMTLTYKYCSEVVV